jgi:hypothetical protein
MMAPFALVFFACAQPLALHGFHPTLHDKHARVIQPTMDRAHAEVAEVVAHVPEVSLQSTAAYGSWFLPHVAVGGDLDFLAVVDLGTLSQDPAAAAQQAVSRIEAVMAVLEDRASDDPTLSLLRVDGLTDSGQVPERAQALSLVEDAVRGVEQGGSEAAFAYKGEVAPYHIAAGVASLTMHPRALYISNTFALKPRRGTHVREVSVQLQFVATTAGGADLSFQPLYARAASPIRSWTMRYELMFADPDDRDWFFEHVLASDVEPAEQAVQYGSLMHRIASGEVKSARPMKAAKRLLQAYLMVAPALSHAHRTAFEREVGGWLESKAAQLDDLAVMATLLEHAGTAATLWNAELEPVLAATLRQLRPLLAPDDHARLATVSDARDWAAVHELAAELARTHGPARHRLDHWSARLGETYAELGCREVPIRGLEEQAVLVASEDLVAQGLSADQLPAWPGPTWEINVVQTPPGPVVRTLYLRTPSPEADALWAHIQATLTH